MKWDCTTILAGYDLLSLLFVSVLLSMLLFWKCDSHSLSPVSTCSVIILLMPLVLTYMNWTCYKKSYSWKIYWNDIYIYIFPYNENILNLSLSNSETLIIYYLVSSMFLRCFLLICTHIIVEKLILLQKLP